MPIVRREFETLALEHIDALYRGALRMTRDPEEAEDLVQDVYVRAIRFYQQFDVVGRTLSFRNINTPAEYEDAVKLG